MAATLKRILTILCLVGLSLTTEAAQSTSTDKHYPMGISPTHVYNMTNTLNAYADSLLKKKRLEVWQALPNDIEKTIRPMVVFQLAIATVEVFHQYELQEGLRPMPIITSSPIEYYPADVAYVVELLIERMKRIAQAEKIFHVSTPTPKSGVRTAYDVYLDLLRFYMKMTALNGSPKIVTSQNFGALHRASEEMESVIVHEAAKLKTALERRLLVTSTMGMHPTGQRVAHAKSDATIQDVFNAMMQSRALLNKLLKQHGLESIPVPMVAKDKQFQEVDVFIQAQIILAELSELKRILGVAESSPVTKHMVDKSDSDVLQEVFSLNYMLERYITVLQSS